MSAFLSLQRSRRGGAARSGRIVGGAAAAALLASVLVSAGAGAAGAAAGNEAAELLAQIEIPNVGDVRGSVYLPPEVGGFAVDWQSSDPAVVTDEAEGEIAAGVVTRPTDGQPAVVTMTACTTVVYIHGCRDIQLTVRPAVGELADPKGYGMVTFQNSASEKIYGATSVGNDALTWEATNGGDPMFTSGLGSTGLRDPSIVRSPEGDKYYMVATDLWTQDPQFNAKGGWGWAQTGGSRAIEVWESDDLKTWSNQRHINVNTSPETGMTFAPEAIWDPEIQQYVVYWSSAIYADGTYYTTDPNDPNRRETDSLKWGRNVTYYVTTRDFVHFSDSKRMYDRCGTDGCAWDKGFGNLDPMIVFNPDDGYYYRAVQDRWDKIFDRLYPDCAQTTTDLYIERSTSILAPAEDWELLGGCLTIDAINGAGLGTASYNEGPNMVKANAGDVNGQGFYLMADGGWTGTDGTRHQGLQPYFATDIASGDFAASLKWNPPQFTGQRAPRAAHGHVFAATAAEHAAFRGAELEGLSVKTAPAKTTYVAGEALDLTGLELEAAYSDGQPGIEITEGFGGYTVSGYDPNTTGAQQVTASFTVAGVTETATFDVFVTVADPSVQITATTRCVAGRVVLATTVKNTTETEVSVDVLTPYGDKTAVTIAASTNASQVFVTRQAEISPGSVSAVVGPASEGNQSSSLFAAASCR
ncbi:bacterial Ig-like domain-containing protein [Agromyces larvae]|uniref:Bacterial Ig-like domain-containing protein n=1 Tax=Agromyces larvae TaxID=2929802 RepID=A0ABY4C5I7_9MICO|nr:bacterial Ig-like domain-containing protein [Agromyces larvae]UOE44020.1 bacterial Ig-like domain-containing protein [Agromyces larvae]